LRRNFKGNAHPLFSVGYNPECQKPKKNVYGTIGQVDRVPHSDLLSKAACPMQQLEKVVGLKRTKGGSSDKELAYLVARDRTKNLGSCLVVTAIVLLVVGLYMKSAVESAKTNSFALRAQSLRLKSSMFRSKMGDMEAAKEGEAKLVKVNKVTNGDVGAFI
jgi:hypothetical protein